MTMLDDGIDRRMAPDIWDFGEALDTRGTVR